MDKLGFLGIGKVGNGCRGGEMLTILKFNDVAGQPRVKLDLPHGRLGDPLGLKLRLERENNGRTEVLSVNGRFRIAAVGLDENGAKQLISVECIDPAPSWVAVKKRPLLAAVARVLGPSRFPRTPIED